MYQTSQDYLLDQLKHYSEAVNDIKRNSIGTRSSSSQATEYCPSLTPATNPNSNIVLKAEIIQKMLSIKSKSSIDKIKSDDVMRSRLPASIEFFNKASMCACCRFNSGMCQVRPFLE
jgi:hypothetical protein